MAGKKRKAKHAVPRRKHTVRIVVACVLAVAVFVTVGVLVGREFVRQSASRPQPQEQAEASAKPTESTKPKATVPTLGSQQDQAAPDQEDPDNSEQEQETEAQVEPAKVEVMMIGDILMHDELVDSGLTGDGGYDFSFIYNNIASEIDRADMRILNQETVMGDPSLGYHLYMGNAGPIMNTPTALADTEASFGFNVILKATNHTLDLGYEGLGHELDYWKANHPKIPVLGVNNPNAAEGDDSQNYVDNVYVTEMNGLKIGILNYTWATNENVDWDSDQRYISYMSEDKVRADVQKARDAGAEMLIACPHWGIEYDTTPSDEEMFYSKLFCELGVDVIFGCHPHILQPVELLQNAEGHKTVCFFSMGNFVAASLMEPSSLIGGVARATLVRNADGTYEVSAASLLPTVICHTYGPHMSAFPITQWTNDLAAESTRPSMTTDYVYSFCADVLGSDFDASTGEFTLDLAAEPRVV